MRTTSVLALLACMAVLLPVSAAQANPAREAAKKVNSYRAAHGLKKLRLSRSLSRSASAYSRRLMGSDRFGHAGRIQASSRFRLLGENLAFRWGWRSSASLPVRAWIRSAPHRAVMLNAGFRYVGVGRSRGRFGSRHATIWVLHAGR